MAIDLTTVHFTGATFSLLFAAIFLSLHRLEGREPSLPLWAAAHAAYALRHATHFLAPPEFYGPWFIPGLSLLFAGFTMAAALALAGRRISLGWLAGAALVEVLWIALSGWAKLPVELRLLPIAAAVGGAMLAAAFAFAVLARQERSIACAAAAAAHLVWSLAAFAILLGTPVAAQSEPGVAMATLGSMAIAILVIITVLRRRRVAADRVAHDLMAAQARLESLIGTASDWIWEIDARHRYTYLSDRFAEITGADTRRLIGARWDTPWSAHRSNERVWADFQAALQVGRPIRGFRHPAHRTDGRPIVLLINADPIRDDAGEVVGFRGTGRDATTEIAVGAIMDVFAGDAANRIGIEYFRTLVGNLGTTLNADAVFAARIRRDGGKSRVTTLAAWSDGAFAENSDYPLEGSLSDCLDSDQPLIFLRDVRSLFVRDPSLAQLSAEGYAGIGLGGDGGQPLGALAVISRHGFTDIATIETVLKVVAPRAAAELERQIADERLRESEARFRDVIDHMPVAIGARDRLGRFMFVNRAYESFNRVAAEGLIGRTMQELTDQLGGGALVERFAEADARVLATGTTIDEEYIRTDRPTPDGPGVFLVSRFPIRDAAGEIIAVGSVSLDITARRAADERLRESEARFRAVMQHMPLAFTARDLEGRHILANPAYEAIAGRKAEELIGRRLDGLEGLPADAPTRFDEYDRRVIETNQAYAHEMDRADARIGGRKSRFLVTRFPIRDAAGRIVAVGSVGTDINELKRIERELRASEARFRSVIEHMPLSFCVRDLDGRFLVTNPTYDAIRGIAAREAIGRSALDFVDAMGGAEAVKTTIDDDAKVIVSGEPFSAEIVLPDRRRGGAPSNLLVTRFPIRDADERIVAVGSVALDVTEERKADDQRRKSEARFRAVVDNIPFGFSLRDREGRFLIVNRAYETMLGLGASQLLGRTPDDLIPRLRAPDIYARWRESDRQVIEGGEPISTETETPNADEPGQLAATHVVKFPVFEGGAAPSGVASIAIDITGRRRMQQAIAAREAELHRVLAALDMAREGIVVEEASGRVLYANRVARAIVEPTGSALALLQRAGHGVLAAGRDHWSGEVALPRDGRGAVIAVDCVVLADGTVVTVLDDVTEEKAQRRETEILERRLRRAEKMEALGRLAGGIAHDFNNLLGAIMGFAGFIAEDAERGGRVHAFAERILAASDRAKGIVREVLAFSRPPEPRRQRIALGGHLVETLEILRPALPAGVTVEIAAHDPEIAIDADPAQLTQVVMNLVLNAADALGGEGGTIEIAADLAEAPAALVADRPEAEADIEVTSLADGRLRCTVGQLRPGPAAVIRVTDRGHGIARQTLERIFDPFFTTKTKGKGTGLGLPVVHGIVLAHHGAILIHTRADEGTTFEVMLPAAAAGELRALDVTARMAAPGRGRVLVVDDDEDFGDMVAIALGRAGYETAVVNHPAAALDVVGEDPTVWDLVITDHTMPGMTGMQLIERLAVLQPDLPCVLCTGFGIGVDEASATAAGASAFLQKPVELGALVEQVGRLIALSRAA